MQPNNTPQSPKTRYRILDEIGSGGMGVVYRVVDRLNQIIVALKEVRIEPKHLSFERSTLPLVSETSLALANEFQHLASMRHPHIISVIDFGFDALGQPFFTMDLLEQPQSITQAAMGQPLETKIRLVIQLLQALEYLHRRQILHRDLKPDNVLVTAEGTVKVLDFGLAVDVDILQSSDDSKTIAGTLAYIAPEILQSQPASIQSDLYSVGIILYEMLTETFPYRRTTTSELIADILTQVPDVDDVAPNLQQVVLRLLDKDPTIRYTDAADVIDALTALLKVARPEETLMIRESFLQAARFVGRDKEIQQLEQALRNVRNHESAIYLIGGESGVGKSRLLDEVRIRALVQRTLVVSGQAQLQGAAPYQLWLDIFRWLCLITPVQDASARILSDVIPDLAQLLDREIEQAAPTDPNYARERLQEAILAQLNLLEEPTVMILEDLQWAGDESIALLQGIAQRLEQYPLLIIGSYRRDEAPELPKRVPGATVQMLERLDVEAVSRLGQSILGDGIENSRLIAFLHEETNGNVFFVIELLRALAENATTLRDIATQPIPNELVAGGMITILQRRLARVPETYQMALHYTALIGRELDLTLLAHLLPDLDTEAFVQVGADLVILEPRENGWRFVHDKLREEVVRTMREDSVQYRSHHQTIAETIEAIYGDQNAYISRLAHHWSEADVPDKAVIYLEKAGMLMNFWDYGRAIDYMNRAIVLDGRLQQPTSRKRQVQRYSVLTNAYYGQGDNNKSFDSYQRLLTFLGSAPLPASNVGTGIRIFKEIIIQLRNRLFSDRYVGQRQDELFDAIVYYALINISSALTYQGRALQSLIASFVALNLVEELEPSDLTSPTVQYAGLGYFSGLMGLHPIARTYLKLSEETSDQSHEWNGLVAAGIAGLYDLHQGRLAAAEVAFIGCVPVFEEMGNYHSLGEAKQMQAIAGKLQGKFDQALDLAKPAYQRAKERDDFALEFSLFMTVSHLVMQRAGFNLDAFDDLATLFDSEAIENRFGKSFTTNVAHRAYYHMTRGLAHAHMEQDEQARHHLQLTLNVLEKAELQRFFTYADLYLGLTTLCELLHRKAPNDATLKAHYQTANKLLMRYAKVFIPAQTAAALHAGWFAHYTGADDAREMMNTALVQAQSLRQPYDEMLAQIGIAIFDKQPNGEAAQRAREIAQQLDAPNPVRRLDYIRES